MRTAEQIADDSGRPALFPRSKKEWGVEEMLAAIRQAQAEALGEAIDLLSRAAASGIPLERAIEQLRALARTTATHRG